MDKPLSPPVARLRELIEADGRTRSQVGAAAGLSDARMTRIFSGRVPVSLDHAARILEALGKTWADLDSSRGL